MIARHSQTCQTIRYSEHQITRHSQILSDLSDCQTFRTPDYQQSQIFSDLSDYQTFRPPDYQTLSDILRPIRLSDIQTTRLPALAKLSDCQTFRIPDQQTCSDRLRSIRLSDIQNNRLPDTVRVPEYQNLRTAGPKICSEYQTFRHTKCQITRHSQIVLDLSDYQTFILPDYQHSQSVRLSDALTSRLPYMPGVLAY